MWPNKFPVHLIKNVYCAAVEWKVPYISVRSALFWSTASLLIFYLDILSTIESGVLKSFAIIVLLSVSPFRSVIIFLKYLGIPMLYIIFIPSWQMIPRYHFWLKVYFVWYKYSSLAFFWLLLKWNIFLYPLEPMYVLKSVSYRQHIVAWNFFSQQTE